MKRPKSNPHNAERTCTVLPAEESGLPERRSETVSVRLPASLLDTIDKLRKPWDVSRGQWVRAAVQQQLDQADTRQLLDKLVREIKTVRRNNGRALLCLLTLLGNIPAEEATEHVRRVLIS